MSSTRAIALAIFLALISGCGVLQIEDVPDCVQANVTQADTCSFGVVACQGTGPQESIWYCKMHLIAADGAPYDAICVPECPMP